MMRRALLAITVAVTIAGAAVGGAMAVVPPDNAIDVSAMFGGDPNVPPDWHLCPECDGNQLVPNPETGMPAPCGTCGGNGVVRDPPADPQPQYDPPPDPPASSFQAVAWMLGPITVVLPVECAPTPTIDVVADFIGF